jgi:hypothetical protein
MRYACILQLGMPNTEDSIQYQPGKAYFNVGSCKYPLRREECANPLSALVPDVLVSLPDYHKAQDLHGVIVVIVGREMRSTDYCFDRPSADRVYNGPWWVSEC